VTSTPLRESQSAVVGVSGRALAIVQPMRAFERWDITRVTVACTSTTLVPTCRVYRSSEAPSNLIEGSFSGNQDSSDTRTLLESGESLVAVWEGQTVGTAGADVGSVCTLTIEGKAIRAV
jgi:hypothetical protein